jgi:N utilization substance protein A
VTILDALGKHMEVIVDDTQLSLAIGKKGQNVRLAAKLLGWKIDIKSEEEKRQEVESQMAALVVPGAPVSVLIEHGLEERAVEKLLEAGIGTVEKLGSMTPEELEEIQGVGPEEVEAIQEAVNAYYAQFETAQPGSRERGIAEQWPEYASESGPPEAAASEGEAEQIETAELLPAGQEQEPGTSGPSHESSTLEPESGDEATEADVASVKRDSHEG